MSEKDSTSLDILGVRPIGIAIETLTEASVKAAGAFLSRICLPATEELGLLLRDRVTNWRAKNAVAMVQKAEEKLKTYPNADKKFAHPRAIAAILENASWTDNLLVQEMWAGLLASSCTEEGKDESNLIFINLLSQITSVEAKILDFSCNKATKYVSKAGWIGATNLSVTLEELKKITGISDIHRLDRELDHMTALELLPPLEGGFDSQSTDADISPTSLALQMYARCQGFNGSPVEYFGLKN